MEVSMAENEPEAVNSPVSAVAQALNKNVSTTARLTTLSKLCFIGFSLMGKLDAFSKYQDAGDEIDDTQDDQR